MADQRQSSNRTRTKKSAGIGDTSISEHNCVASNLSCCFKLTSSVSLPLIAELNVRLDACFVVLDVGVAEEGEFH